MEESSVKKKKGCSMTKAEKLSLKKIIKGRELSRLNVKLYRVNMSLSSQLLTSMNINDEPCR